MIENCALELSIQFLHVKLIFTLFKFNNDSRIVFLTKQNCGGCACSKFLYVAFYQKKKKCKMESIIMSRDEKLFCLTGYEQESTKQKVVILFFRTVLHCFLSLKHPSTKKL